MTDSLRMGWNWPEVRQKLTSLVIVGTRTDAHSVKSLVLCWSCTPHLSVLLSFPFPSTTTVTRVLCCSKLPTRDESPQRLRFAQWLQQPCHGRLLENKPSCCVEIVVVWKLPGTSWHKHIPDRPIRMFRTRESPFRYPYVGQCLYSVDQLLAAGEPRRHHSGSVRGRGNCAIK